MRNTLNVSIAVMLLTLFIVLPSSAAQAEESIKYELSYLANNTSSDLTSLVNLSCATDFEASKRNLISVKNASEGKWFCLDIENLSYNNQTRILHLTAPFFYQYRDIKLFYYDAEQRLITEAVFGWSVPFDEEYFRRFYPEVYLDVPSGKSKMLLYVRSKFPAMFPVSLHTEQEVRNESLKIAFFWGVFYGAMVFIGIFNFLRYVVSGQSLYGLYAFCLVTFSFGSLCMNSTLDRVLALLEVHSSVQLSFFIMLLYSSSILVFVCRFINIKQSMQKTYGTIKFLLLANGIVFSLGFFTKDVENWGLVIYILFSVSSLLILFTVTRIALKKGGKNKLFAMAMICPPAGNLVTNALLFTDIPYSFLVAHGIAIGFFIDAIILSYLVADRVRVFSDKQTEAIV